MRRPDRRGIAAGPRTAAAAAVLAVVALAVVTLFVGSGPIGMTGIDGSNPLRIRGADISFTLQEESAGTTVRGLDGEAPLEAVLARHGADAVRLRLWVDPAPGTSDLAAALRLGRRAADAGLDIILALHNSDTWADHRTQQTPAAWAALDLDALARTVETYTRDVVAAFAAQGTPVAIVQVGNEIDNGLLWPAGDPVTAGWAAVTRLVGAGAAGARTAGGAHPPEVMVHLAASGNAEAALRLLGDLRAGGVHPDLFGFSYYPWWNGSLATLQHTLDTVASAFDIDVLLAETAYPWTLDDGDTEPNVVTDESDLPDGARYPATPAGQAGWTEALRDVLLRVPDGHGAGFLFWEPGWLPGIEAAPGVGSAYDNTTLFTWDGAPLPALAGLRRPDDEASAHRRARR